MSEPQPEDPSSTALTEIEELLLIRDDLTTAVVANSAITRLIRQSTANLSLPRLHADVLVSFQNFSRLLGILNKLMSRGIAGTSLLTFMAAKFTQKKNAYTLWHTDEMPKSALHLFEDLDHWTTLNTMLTNMFPLDTVRGWIINVKSIISLDVNALVALPVQPTVSSDSLQVVKIGAKLLKTLPQHCAEISQVIDSQIKALTASSAHMPGLNYGHDHLSHAVLESNDSQIDLNLQTGNELTAINSNHVNVTVALRDQIQQLQEQVLQLEAVNHGLQQESTSLTEEKIRLEGQADDLTHDVQSTETEISVLQSRINDLQSENAGLKEEYIASKDRHQIAIRKLDDEVANLQQALSDSRDDDDRISFQSRAEKLIEELAEAEEDKAALTRDVARLAADKAIVEEALAKSEDSKMAMSSENHELGTNIDRLEKELKDSSDSLEEAEDNRAALSRKIGKLSSNIARLQNILDQISSFSASIRPVDPDSAFQSANADDGTDTAASSTGMLTPSSTQTTLG